MKVGWVPNGEVGYHEWIEMGRYLGALGRGSRWWVADWLLYARGKWGEMYSEAVKITGYDYGSLRNMASVAQKFDLSRRRDKLSYDHHAVVVGLAPDEQDHWLDEAVALKWSREDLRIELRSSQRALKKAEDGDDHADPSDGHSPSMVCPHCGGTIPLDPDAVKSSVVLAE